MKRSSMWVGALVLIAVGFFAGGAYTSGSGGGGSDTGGVPKTCKTPGEPCEHAANISIVPKYIFWKRCKLTFGYDRTEVASDVEVTWYLPPLQPNEGTLAFDAAGVVIGQKSGSKVIADTPPHDFLNGRFGATQDTWIWTAAPSGARDKSARRYGFQALWTPPGGDPQPCDVVDPVIVNSL